MTVTVAEAAGDGVAPLICPACGTRNTPGAKFCRNDGVALTGASGLHRPARSLAAAGSLPRRFARRGPIIGGLVALLLIAAAGSAWWLGLVGDRRSRIAADVQAELAASGMTRVAVDVDRDWTARLTGEVSGRAAHEVALSMAGAHQPIKSVIDQLTIVPTAGERIEAAVGALRDAGIGQAQVVAAAADGTSLILTGEFESREAADRALSVVQAATGATVADRTSRGAAWTVNVVVAALNENGLGGITVTGDSGSAVTLDGAMSSDADTVRAENVARRAGVTTVTNRLTVPAPAQDAMAPAAPADQ